MDSKLIFQILVLSIANLCIVIFFDSISYLKNKLSITDANNKSIIARLYRIVNKNLFNIEKYEQKFPKILMIISSIILLYLLIENYELIINIIMKRHQ